MGLAACTEQPRVAAALIAALSRGRLGQAYLFAGPEGSGKRRMALELAKAALCPEAVGADACDKCASCLAIEGGRHPDVSVFQPEAGKASYPVRQVREEIRKHACLKPDRGARRFLIIDRAEALVRGSGGQNEGADTLLKLLEEPPEKTTIVLLAAHPERLPETIRSRCQRLRFDPPDPTRLAATLVREDGVEPGQAFFVAHLAGGDLALARSFVGAGGKGGAESGKDRPDVGALRETLLAWARSLGKLPFSGLFTLAAELDAAARGWPALTGALGVLASLYRDAALRSAAASGDATGNSHEAALTFPDGEEAEVARELAAVYRPERLAAMARRALGAQADSRRSPARLLLLEVLLIDLRELYSAGKLS